MRVAGSPYRRAFAWMAAAVCATTSAQAVADDAGGEPERTLERGVELRRLGRNAEALEAFEQAYALEPSPRVAAQIALARQALGDWVGAEEGLEGALAAGGDPWILRYRGALEQALATVRAHLGFLQVDTNVHDGEVQVGGAPVRALPLMKPLRVPAGTTRIEVRAGGYRAEQRTVSVDPGTTLRVGIVLSPTTAPDADFKEAPATHEAQAPGSQTRSHVPAYVALGAAAALAVGGIVAWRIREDVVGIYNDNSRCRVGALTRAEQCAGWSQEADVALGVEVGAFVGAGIAAAIGGWDLLRAPSGSSSATLRCAPWRGAGVSCAGTF